MRRSLIGVGLLLLAMRATLPKSPVASAQSDKTADALRNQEYVQLLRPYQDWTFDQLAQHLKLANEERIPLSFSPADARFYDAIRRSLQMTDDERAKFEQNGFVVVDPKQRQSFASIYHAIYSSDLPVLVTTDSVLHAWHRSYAELLKQLEGWVLMPALSDLLRCCHEELAVHVSSARPPTETHQDVDLYLTVARNLLAGAGGPRWRGELIVPSVCDMDEEAVARLEDIKSLKLQVQTAPADSTRIYGGERYVDYSQFQPRGHYSSFSHFQNYFRAMMWLGRADCGFHILPVDPAAGLRIDWQRELGSAALLTQLVHDSGSMDRLTSFSAIVQLLVGESDNLTIEEMLAVLEAQEVSIADVLEGDQQEMEELALAISKSGQARQRIRSQSITSNLGDVHRVPPPALLQMFGQGFTVDSLLLSHVVYDSIVFADEKKQRMMPSSLDVAAALGNNYAVRLLEPELRRWKYSANMLAGREFVANLPTDFWDSNVYHRWIAALRTLDDLPTSEHLPEVLKRPVWSAKQLQTQLASWSELRHDFVLYAKQSFTGVPGCQYPDCYVEPYPNLFGELGQLTTEFARRLAQLDMSSVDGTDHGRAIRLRDKQIKFLRRFSEIMEQLQSIAQREVAGEPMTDAQRRFVEATIDRRGTVKFGSGGRPRLDGWFADLLYKQPDEVDLSKAWSPTIVDVHTNPRAHEALHAGVGDVNFAVIALNHQEDVVAYVGPVYSFYEFVHPAEERLTDSQWAEMIAQDRLPPRPTWTGAFAAPAAQRSFDRVSVHSRGKWWVIYKTTSGQLKEVEQIKATDEGLRRLLDYLSVNGIPNRFGLTLGDLSEEGLQLLVDVKQLAWIDQGRNDIPEAVVNSFRDQRPDVDVLSGELKMASLLVLRKIDEQRFAVMESNTIEPGQPAWIHVEPVNMKWVRFDGEISSNLKVRIALVDAAGSLVTEKKWDAVKVDPAEPYTQLALPIPENLQAGDYRIRVEVQDLVAAPPATAKAMIAVKY